MSSRNAYFKVTRRVFNRLEQFDQAVTIIHQKYTGINESYQNTKFDQILGTEDTADLSTRESTIQKLKKKRQLMERA